MGCDYAAGAGPLVLRGPFCFLGPAGRHLRLSRIGPAFWTAFGHPAKCASPVLTRTRGNPGGLLDDRYRPTAADLGGDPAKNGRLRQLAKRSKMDSANRSWLIPPEYEFRPLDAQHLIWRHETKTQPDAHVRDLDLLQ